MELEHLSRILLEGVSKLYFKFSIWRGNHGLKYQPHKLITTHCPNASKDFERFGIGERCNIRISDDSLNTL